MCKGSIYVPNIFQVAGPKGNKACLHFLLSNALRYHFTPTSQILIKNLIGKVNKFLLLNFAEL